MHGRTKPTFLVKNRTTIKQNNEIEWNNDSGLQNAY